MILVMFYRFFKIPLFKPSLSPIEIKLNQASLKQDSFKNSLNNLYTAALSRKEYVTRIFFQKRVLLIDTYQTIVSEILFLLRLNKAARARIIIFMFTRILYPGLVI